MLPTLWIHQTAGRYRAYPLYPVSASLGASIYPLRASSAGGHFWEARLRAYKLQRSLESQRDCQSRSAQRGVDLPEPLPVSSRRFDIPNAANTLLFIHIRSPAYSVQPDTTRPAATTSPYRQYSTSTASTATTARGGGSDSSGSHSSSPTGISTSRIS